MVTYALRLPAAEVIYLLRAEIEAEHGEPELNMAIDKQFLIEEEFDRIAYGINNGEEYDLVTSIATLTIEPRVESGYWILEVIIERSLGPLRMYEEYEFMPTELTLNEFEAELSRPEQKRITVRLHVQAPPVRQEFDRWLAEIRARHPWKTQAVKPGTDVVSETQAHS